MTASEALRLVNRESRLAWMSPTARAILAYAIASGDPLRPVSVTGDAEVLVRAEQLHRVDGLRIDHALAAARAEEIDDATLRGCVRAASSLLETDELSAQLMERGIVHVEDLDRPTAAELALDLFSRSPATITETDLIQQLELLVAAPAEIDVELDGVVVARCAHCENPVTDGAATIGIWWKGSWESLTPGVVRTGTVMTKLMRVAEEVRTIEARGAELVKAGERGGAEWAELKARRHQLNGEYRALDVKYEASLTAAPRAGTKLRLFVDGELPAVCSACWMRHEHAGLELLAPDAGITPASPDPAQCEAVGAPENAGEDVAGIAATPESPPEEPFMGGLLDVDRSERDALDRLPAADPRRVAALEKVVPANQPHRPLAIRLLALAWQAGKPLKPGSSRPDAEKLRLAVDTALRGGNALWILGAVA